jgi:hypothetical protein
VKKARIVMAKKPEGKNDASKKAPAGSGKKASQLEDRKDLYSNWIVKTWFNKGMDNNYLRKIYLELFMSLYDDISNKFSDKKRDDLFTNFTNVVFPTVLDVYKWHESEKELRDIGLMKALEDIAMCDWYIELLTSYSNQYDNR